MGGFMLLICSPRFESEKGFENKEQGYRREPALATQVRRKENCGAIFSQSRCFSLVNPEILYLRVL